MKKLMTLITAVALGAFAWAADEPDGFNGNLQYSPADLQVGPTNIVGYADDATTTWTENQDAPLVHWWANDYTNHIESADYEQPAEVAEDTIGEETAKVLKIEADTANPMLRTFNRVKKESGVYNVYPQPIGTLGLFADTKIKLSASEEAPQDFTGKIAVWLHAVPAEEGVTEGFTNLMVTCGQLDKDTFAIAGATNIAIAATGVTVKPEEWHRITIRSIKELATGKTVPGFVIYVDGVLAQAADGAYVLPSGLTAKAAEFAGQNALFASASSDVDTAQTLESVGIAGNGSLSYIDLTDMVNAPIFAQDPTDVVLTWDDYVVGVKIGDKTLTDTEVEAGEFAYRVTAFGTPVDVELTLNELYKIKGITPTGLQIDIDEEDNTKFTFTPGQSFDDSQAVAITTVEKREGAGLEVNGESFGNFPYVKDAVAKLGEIGEIASAKITMKESETITDFGDWSDLTGHITLDLNGKTIAVAAEGAWEGTVSGGDRFNTNCMIKNANGATITVTNSVEGVGQMIGCSDVAILCNENGTVYLTDANIKYNGAINSFNDGDDFYGEMTIFGGKFKPQVEFRDDSNGLADDKVWSDAADGEGFWAVVDYVPPTGTVIIITDGGKTTNYVESIAKAVEDVEDGDTIQLLADQNMAAMVDITKTVAIDLNGKTVAPAAEDLKTLFHVYNGGELNITGTTDGSAMKGRITVGKGTNQNGTLTINGGTYTAGTFRNGAFDDNNEDCFIQSNGTCDNCVVTATDAIFNSKDDTFYLAAKGTYTFTRCTINGYTGIYAKGGTVDLVDTDVFATGAKAVPAENHNGASSTGDAVIFDSLAGYNGEMSLNVDADSKLSSANGYAFQETVSDGKSPSATIAVAIDPNATLTGEIKLSDNFAAKVAAGGASITGYVATVDGIAYASAAAALAAVQAKEVGDDYTIKVAALAALELTQDPQTIKLAKGDTVTITQNKWAFSGALDGTIVLLPGKTITAASEAAGLSVTTPSADDEVVKTPGTPITWTVQAIPTFDVTFTKDNVEVGSPKTVKRDYELTQADVPAISDEGAWDVQPVGAVITSNTNFNFTVKQGGIEPGKDDPTDYTKEQAEEAAKKATVAVPEDVKDAGVNETEYKALFAGKAVEVSPGVFHVKMDLTAAVVTEIQPGVNSAEADIVADIADQTATTITATIPADSVKAGLYYGIVAVGELDAFTTAKPASMKMATHTGVALELTPVNKDPMATKGFYKTVCSPVDLSKAN